MPALARKDSNSPRAEVEAALLRLNPELDHETLQATMRRLVGTVRDEWEAIEALAARRKQKNELIDQMRQLLDEMTRPDVVDPTDPPSCAGMEAWQEIRRAWRDVASGLTQS
jgi:hypothetical protein